MSEIEDLIKKFKETVLKKDESYIVEKFIIHGSPYIFRSNDDLYFELKNVISRRFRTDNTNVIMVGSAKLGFSIKPTNLWHEIHDNSDIDMTIISDKLFDYYWREMFKCRIGLEVRSEKEDKEYKDFLEYFFKGWIRFDKFPFRFKYRNEWDDFFSKISYKDFDNRKVTGAIFKSQYFFKYYHVQNIRKIKNDLGGQL